tara:strand:- start:186 stop:611 length:426 start_codon:yes stop_codon:yes gene_type:complete
VDCGAGLHDFFCAIKIFSDPLWYQFILRQFLFFLRQFRWQTIGSFEIDKQAMFLVPLIVGIAIGLALGVILMILFTPKGSELVEPHYQLELLYDDDQIHESGFIDIPIKRIVSVKKNHRKKVFENHEEYLDFINNSMNLKK